MYQESARVERVQERFREALRLPHVDEDAILDCPGGDDDALEELAIRLHLQTERARKVFDLLDAAGKGVVVLEDLQRFVGEVLTGGDSTIDDDDLMEMVEEFDTSGCGLLSRDDLVLIARKVGL